MFKKYENEMEIMNDTNLDRVSITTLPEYAAAMRIFDKSGNIQTIRPEKINVYLDFNMCFKINLKQISRLLIYKKINTDLKLEDLIKINNDTLDNIKIFKSVGDTSNEYGIRTNIDIGNSMNIRCSLRIGCFFDK